MRRIIQEHQLAGLVLLVRTMPDDMWFEKTTKLLETTSANIIVIQREAPIFSDKPAEPGQTVATLREIQRGSLLFQPNEQSWQVDIQDYDLWTPGTAIPSATPNVIVLGSPAARARELNAMTASLLSATNSLPVATNSIPVATNSLPAATNSVTAATNATSKATNAGKTAKATTNSVTSAKAEVTESKDKK